MTTFNKKVFEGTMINLIDVSIAPILAIVNVIKYVILPQNRIIFYFVFSHLQTSCNSKWNQALNLHNLLTSVSQVLGNMSQCHPLQS